MAQLTDLEKIRRQRARRRTVRGLLLLGIFAVVVFGCAALVRQLGSVDLKTAYSDIKEGLSTGTGYPVALPGGYVVELDAAGETLVLLSDTNLYTYNDTGRQMMNAQHGMINPAVITSRDRILAYDRGGNKLNVYTKSALAGSGTSPNVLYSVDLAANGNYVAVSDAKDTLAKAVVYNAASKNVMEEGKDLFTWNSSERPIISASLADNANELLVGHVDVSGGAYKSDIQKFLLSYGEGDIGRVELPGELLLSVESRRDGGARAITDHRALLLNGALQETGSFLFEDRVLNSFTESPDGMLALALGNFDKEKKLTICTLSPTFQTLATFDVAFDLLSMKADDSYLYLGGQEKILILEHDGTLVAELPVQNLHTLQPIGQYLYCATNTTIDQIDVKALTAALYASSGSSSAQSASSGAAPEESTPEERASEPSEASADPSADEPAEATASTR